MNFFCGTKFKYSDIECFQESFLDGEVYAKSGNYFLRIKKNDSLFFAEPNEIEIFNVNNKKKLSKLQFITGSSHN
jgi:hypothetical protein